MLSRILEWFHDNTTELFPLCSSLTFLGGVGNPGCGTLIKYTSSSSDGKGDKECGTVPVI